MTRSIPQCAVDFTAQHEGCKLRAYQDSIGVWTIGFGHIEGVKPGQTINRSTALAYLRTDMQIAVRKLYSVLKPDVIEGLGEHQWAALLSFAFNVGCKAPKWGLWKHINAGKLDLVPVEMMKFTNAGGRRIPGLVQPPR
jgi:lysozyme